MIHVADIEKLMNTQVELNSHLLPYIDVSCVFLPMLRSPLVFCIPYIPTMNALLNSQYKYKTQMADEYLNKGDYEAYVFLHERPYRFQAFQKVISKLNDIQYWQILSSLWVDSENIWQNKCAWRQVFKARIESRHYFMSVKDKKVFNELPDTIDIHRGYTIGKNKSGFSYSLDYSKAEWFANRFNKSGAVHSRTVSKSDVLAYTNQRSENEIIIIK